MLISEFSWKSRSRVTALQNARTNWTWRDEAACRGWLRFSKGAAFPPGDDAMKPTAPAPGASVFLGCWRIETRVRVGEVSPARCHLRNFLENVRILQFSTLRWRALSTPIYHYLQQNFCFTISNELSFFFLTFNTSNKLSSRFCNFANSNRLDYSQQNFCFIYLQLLSLTFRANYSRAVFAISRILAILQTSGSCLGISPS